VDLAMELRAYGGIYGGNNKATDFLCLTLKMVGLTNIC
jgi:pre-mRNA-splicing factor 38A